MKARVTLEDTFMDNTTMPIFRIRRDGLMVACIHYRPLFLRRWRRYRRPGMSNEALITRSQALRIAREIQKAVTR